MATVTRTRTKGRRQPEANRGPMAGRIRATVTTTTHRAGQQEGEQTAKAVVVLTHRTRTSIGKATHRTGQAEGEQATKAVVVLTHRTRAVHTTLGTSATRAVRNVLGVGADRPTPEERANKGSRACGESSRPRTER